MNPLFLYFFVELKRVPSPKTTAKSILDNFFNYNSRVGKRGIGEEDIVLVMDGSGSVRSCQFNYGRDALAASIKSCRVKELESNGPNCRTAAVTFSDHAYVNFNFLPADQAERRVKLISYPNGATNTQAGLAKAENLIRTGQ